MNLRPLDPQSSALPAAPHPDIIIFDNDNILITYKSELIRLGLKNKIGIQCSESFLSKITWSVHQRDWLLWTIHHVSKLSELDKLLDPTFFDIKEKYV